MGQEVDFPAWWQSKITVAKENLDGAKHYLEFEINEPKIDAAIDALTGEEPHMGEPEAPMMEAEGTLNQVRNELLGLFQPFGDFQILDMTMKGQNTGTEFRLYSKSKGANWKGLENFMRNNPDFTIKHISKQTFDNPKAIDFSYKKSPMMEAEISAEEKLAGKIAKALKDMANKDASDQHNLKQARTALNKGNIDAAKKIADPYLEEGLPKGYFKKELGIGGKKKTVKEDWDTCIAKITDQGKSQKAAEKICGAINAAYVGNYRK
jgi:hypothetical protein